jgi:O-antigen ligase
MYASATCAFLAAILSRTDIRPFLVGWPWAVALSCWMIISNWTSPYHSAGGIPGFVYCWPMLAFWAATATDLRRLRFFLIALLCGGGLALSLSAAQFFIGYDEGNRPWRISSNGQQRIHASGFYSHWIRFGDAMAIWGAWLTAWLLHTSAPLRRTWFQTSLALVASMVGVLFSSARGSLMAGIAGYWAAIAGYGHRRAWTATIVAGTLALVLISVAWIYQPQRIRDALHGNDGRTYIWATAWQAFLQHPITGIGNNAYDEAAKAVVAAGLSEAGPEGPDMGNAHNAYLSLLVLHGIPGLALWLGWLGTLTWTVWKRRHNHPVAWPLACATLAVILVGGLTEDLARYASSRFQLLFGLSLALGMTLHQRHDERLPGNTPHVMRRLTGSEPQDALNSRSESGQE